MSGFFAVKSSVRPCMRIMSPLFTVAIVRVVSACAKLTKASVEAAAKNAVLSFMEFLPSDQL